MTEASDLSCQVVVRRLYGYLDGELDTEAGDAIRAHLEFCGRCSRKAAFEAQLLEGLRGRLREVWTPPALTTRVGSILRSCRSRGRVPDGGAA